MLFKALNILLLVSSIQGVIFAVFAFTFKKFKGKSTLYLGLLILALALSNLQYLLWETDLIDGNIFYGLYFIPYETIIPVFFYFYVKFFLFPKQKMYMYEKWYFLPFILFFILGLIYKISYFHSGNHSGNRFLIDKMVVIQSVFSILFTFIFCIISIVSIQKYKKKQITDTADMPIIRLNWLIGFVGIFVLFCVFWSYGFLNELSLGNEKSERYYLLWLFISINIYVFGHIGLYHFGLNLESTNIHKFISKTPNPVLIENYKNSYISAFKDWIIEDKKYLDSELSLEKAANELGLSKGHFSRILHAELDIGFNDYINKLRIEEAVLYLKSNEFDNYTIEALGIQSGFNSKSSFNSAFKKFVGCTPKEFKKLNYTPQTNY